MSVGLAALGPGHPLTSSWPGGCGRRFRSKERQHGGGLGPTITNVHTTQLLLMLEALVRHSVSYTFSRTHTNPRVEERARDSKVVVTGWWAPNGLGVLPSEFDCLVTPKGAWSGCASFYKTKKRLDMLRREDVRPRALSVKGLVGM